jgi:hypothetical protein
MGQLMLDDGLTEGGNTPPAFMHQHTKGSTQGVAGAVTAYLYDLFPLVPWQCPAQGPGWFLPLCCVASGGGP